MTPRQLPLPLTLGAAGLAEDTFVWGDWAERARAALSSPELWPRGALALLGAPGSGKSALSAVWLAERAEMQDTGARVLEDVDRNPPEPHRFLALLDQCAAGEAGPLLVTARSEPETWPAGLPDLVSRHKALMRVWLETPSRSDLAAVVMAYFTARGVDASLAVIDYALDRAPRAVGAARMVAEALDRRALAEGRKVTRPLAEEVMDELDFHDPSHEP